MSSLPDSQARSCPSCGHPLPPGAAFCRNCGAEVKPPEVAPAPEPAPAPTPGAAPAPPAPPPAPAPPPTPPSSPASPPATTQPPGRRRRAALIAVVAVLLIAAGAGAAILLTSSDEDSGQTATAPATDSATVPASAAPPSQSGEASAAGSSENAATESEAEMAAAIQSLLLAYHEDVVEGRMHDAWLLLSARKRAQSLREGGYAKWAHAQASLAPYLSPAGVTVHVDGREEGGEVARVLVRGMGWSEPGASCSEWSGLTWAKHEDSHWTYDPGFSTTPARKRAWEPRYEQLLGANC
jgi:Double zinc ribbon